MCQIECQTIAMLCASNRFTRQIVLCLLNCFSNQQLFACCRCSFCTPAAQLLIATCLAWCARWPIPKSPPLLVCNMHGEIKCFKVRDSIVVSISACHAEDPGSIPGRGIYTGRLLHPPPQRNGKFTTLWTNACRQLPKKTIASIMFLISLILNVQQRCPWEQ